MKKSFEALSGQWILLAPSMKLSRFQAFGLCPPSSLYWDCVRVLFGYFSAFYRVFLVKNDETIALLLTISSHLRVACLKSDTVTAFILEIFDLSWPILNSKVHMSPIKAINTFFFWPALKWSLWMTLYKPFTKGKNGYEFICVRNEKNTISKNKIYLLLNDFIYSQVKNQFCWLLRV